MTDGQLKVNVAKIVGFLTPGFPSCELLLLIDPRVHVTPATVFMVARSAS